MISALLWLSFYIFGSTCGLHVHDKYFAFSFSSLDLLSSTHTPVHRCAPASEQRRLGAPTPRLVDEEKGAQEAMDCDTFSRIVRRVMDSGVAKHKRRPLRWAEVAEHIASALSAFPDGVTEAMLLSSISTGARDRPSDDACMRVSDLRSSRRVEADDVLDLVIRARTSARMLELHDLGDDGKGPSVAHALASVPLEGALFHPGRRLRLTGCVVAEAAATGGGPLCLLPTAQLALVLDGTHDADRRMIERARPHSRVRGRAALEERDPPLLLRLSHVSEREVHNGSELRRLLLTLDSGADGGGGGGAGGGRGAGSSVDDGGTSYGSARGEIEAELLLWDSSTPLAALVPPHALLCLFRATLLTAGDPSVGGAPAQLMLESTSTLAIVNESKEGHAEGADERCDEPCDQTCDEAEGGDRAPHHARKARRGSAGARLKVAGGVLPTRSADRAGCLGPPLQCVGWEGGAIQRPAVLGHLVAVHASGAECAPPPQPPSPLGHYGGDEGSAAAASLTLVVWDGEGEVLVDLWANSPRDAEPHAAVLPGLLGLRRGTGSATGSGGVRDAGGGAGGGVLDSLAATLHAGHHLLLCNLHRTLHRPAEEATAEEAMAEEATADPHPCRQGCPRYWGWLSEDSNGGGRAGGVRVFNLSCLRAGLRSPSLLMPRAPARAALRDLSRGAEAHAGGRCGAALSRALACAGEAGKGDACPYFSSIAAAMSAIGHRTSTPPFAAAVTNACLVSAATPIGPPPSADHARSHTPRPPVLRLTIDDGQSVIECVAGPYVCTELMDATCEALGAMSALERSERIRAALVHERLWVLTRLAPTATEWRADACASLRV